VTEQNGRKLLLSVGFPIAVLLLRSVLRLVMRMALRGESEQRLHAHTKRMAMFSLPPFALALGANFGVALAAALCWFAPALARRRTG